MRTTWNYRVLTHPDESVAIHEVYYDDGVPTSWSAEPAIIGFWEDVEGLRSELTMFGTATDLPPLRVDGDRLLSEEQS